MAPSSRSLDRAGFDQSVAYLKELGFNVYVHPQTWATHHQSAGTVDQKIAAFYDLLEHPDIKAVFAARGGNRGGMMLADIDEEKIRSHPKILLGFSDVTVLLNALQARTGLVGLYGPDMERFGRMPLEDQKQCLALMAGETPDIPLSGACVLRDGETTGKLVGGSLSAFQSLLGTPWQPDFTDAILFLEDTGDELSRYDRMFIHLRNAGAFDRLAGLVLGDFGTPLDTGSTPFGFTLKDIVREHTDGWHFPVVMNAPFGHGPRLPTFPIGAPARLTAEKSGATLRFPEAVVCV
ncbi:MAG: LD-carboxypeptidase [Alphaproteobacteria bacterium]|nr:LD-carboxypeptidase [Alphaproteobacteria bacterium]